MYCVAANPVVQDKLRSELFTIATEHPSIEQLLSLKYLDQVLREVARLYPAIPSSLRMAMEDDLLPLEEPVRINGMKHDFVW